MLFPLCLNFSWPLWCDRRMHSERDIAFNRDESRARRKANGWPESTRKGAPACGGCRPCSRAWSVIQYSEVNWSELKWSEVKWFEVKWIEVNWSELKWSEVKWSGVRWSEVKWSEVKWSELKWTISWTFIPLWWHRKFQNMSRSATHNTPISDAELFPTCAWSHRYIGRGSGKTEIPLLDSERYWISKTEGSPIGFIAILWRLKTCKIAVVKVVDFDHLRALFGPGAPDAESNMFKLEFSDELRMYKNLVIPCENCMCF